MGKGVRAKSNHPGLLRAFLIVSASMHLSRRKDGRGLGKASLQLGVIRTKYRAINNIHAQLKSREASQAEPRKSSLMEEWIHGNGYTTPAPWSSVQCTSRTGRHIMWSLTSLLDPTEHQELHERVC